MLSFVFFGIIHLSTFIISPKLYLFQKDTVDVKTNDFSFLEEENFSDYQSNLEEVILFPEYGIGEFKNMYIKKNLNILTIEDLRNFQFLSEKQIQSFLRYRNTFKNFHSIQELISIESWDVQTIQQIQPYVYIDNASLQKSYITPRDIKSVLILTSRLPIETAEGFLRNPDSQVAYIGSKDRSSVRLRANSQAWNLFVQGGKSFGERNVLSHGFDFYSGSLQYQSPKKSFLRNLILGDYTVQLGQGLIEWQSFALYRNIETVNIVRDDDYFKPFRGISNYRKRRGLAGYFQNNGLQFGGFVSLDYGDSRIDLGKDNDTNLRLYYYNPNYYSHKTQTEIDRKYNTQITSYGGFVQLLISSFQVGINLSQVSFQNNTFLPVMSSFRIPVQSRDYFNASIDWKGSIKNIFLFGEVAIDKNMHLAFIKGMQIPIDRHIDMSILLRHFSPEYISLYSNAFRNSTYTNNESGFYLGLQYFKRKKIRANFYMDIYQRPEYRNTNKELLYGFETMGYVQYFFSKQLNALMHYKYSKDYYTQVTENNALPYKDSILSLHSVRFQIHYKPHDAFQLRWRNDFKFNYPFFDPNALSYVHSFRMGYKFFRMNLRVFCGLLFFDILQSTQAISVYENDLKYNFNIERFYNSGWRYYGIIHYTFFRNYTLSLKWSQTIFSKYTTSSSLSHVSENTRSEIALQLIKKL